jgi:hypothetical protein
MPAVVGQLRAGRTRRDLALVVWNRCDVWGDSERMADNLRPSTLFGPKFAEYLAAAKAAFREWQAEEAQDAAPAANEEGGALALLRER